VMELNGSGVAGWKCARLASRAGASVLLAAVAICGAAVGVAGATERLVPTQYATIQAAINVSVDGDVVTVADGVYTGTGNRDVEFLGKALTVRSAHGPVHCIIDCQATVEDKHRGFRFNHNETAAAVLDGFTIQNGYAPLEPDCFYSGGGILCYYASPTIRNCILRWNQAEE
jgi:hypothetical protein